MNDEPRTYTMWAVQKRRGRKALYPWTVRLRRKDAIAAFDEDETGLGLFRSQEVVGNVICHKVQVTPIP